MSLNLYLRPEDCPVKLIRNNDAYFKTYSRIPDTDAARKILQDVDKASYVSPVMFRSNRANLGDTNAINLSTGTKTLFNIIQHPDLCFTLEECGANALRLLYLLTDGNAYCPKFGVQVLGDPSCDIMCDGKHFTKFVDLVEYVYDLD